MDTLRSSSDAPVAAMSAAQIAKAALRRLALERLEPTPENYTRIYRDEAGESSSASVWPIKAQRALEKLSVRAFEGDAKAAGTFCQSMALGRWDQAERVLETPKGEHADSLALLIERIVKGLERGGRTWTPARRRDGLQRVLAGNRSDSRRLQQRLGQLMASWEGDFAPTGYAEEVEALEAVQADDDAGGPAPALASAVSAEEPFTQNVASTGGARAVDDPSAMLPANVVLTTDATTTAEPPTRADGQTTADAAMTAGATTADPTTADATTADPTTADATTADATTADRATADATTADATATAIAKPTADASTRSASSTTAGLATAARDHAVTVDAWRRVVRVLCSTLSQAMPPHDGAGRTASTELDALAERLGAEAATPALALEFEAVCQRGERVLQHRHHLFDQLGKLCHELTSSLSDLAENDSWVKGQCDAMRMKIEEGLTARGVRQVGDMLHHARMRHGEVRVEREKARDGLKVLMTQMLGELGELGLKTGNFHASVGRYASVIEESDSLESLTGVVREMVAESRTVQTLVQETQARLQEEHSKATGLTRRVTQLEDEMKRLSDEVSTDQLTQVANRRGLLLAFETERARLERNGGHLSIGLLDIDNFKKLNDELGHVAGDEALKSLAAIVSKTLRPTDRVARYGGEEFVVLLPETPVDEGEQVLTRLQRSLTGGLFMHKQKQVFVTFSAGVTAYRLEERIEDSLERADQALYEAKRTGKNRTCTG